MIPEKALHNRSASFVIDGEAVLLGADGKSDFARLHSRKHNGEVQLTYRWERDIWMRRRDMKRKLCSGSCEIKRSRSSRAAPRW